MLSLFGLLIVIGGLGLIALIIVRLFLRLLLLSWIIFIPVVLLMGVAVLTLLVW